MDANDDGYDAEGIDALVEGLSTLDDVEITVVAPATQQSGTGGSETEGELTAEEVELRSGHPATAVEGFRPIPLRVRDHGRRARPGGHGHQRGPEPRAGGRCLGTVGAARKAVSFGVPALATSQGLADELDYDVAVPLILDWVAEHRDALAAGDVPVEVTNLQRPELRRGRAAGPAGGRDRRGRRRSRLLGAPDCTSTAPRARSTATSTPSSRVRHHRRRGRHAGRLTAAAAGEPHRGRGGRWRWRSPGSRRARGRTDALVAGDPPAARGAPVAAQ
ncbi:MAG: 5'/3'-nucleotidase SurE [Acidimicrobiales bacterium]